MPTSTSKPHIPMLVNLVVSGLLLMALPAMIFAQAEPVAPGQAPSRPGQEIRETSADAEAASPPPLAPPLSPIVLAAINDPINTPQQKQALQIFHGQWADVSDPTPTEQAQIALARFDLSNPIFADEYIPALVRAQAYLQRGQLDEAYQLVKDDTQPVALWIAAQSLEQQGELAQAEAALDQLLQTVQSASHATAEDFTAAGQAMVLLAELRGSGSADYRQAMAMFARALEVDRLHHPALAAQAKLLASRDNPAEARAAASEALQLAPHSGLAWYVLGEMAADHFNFELAGRIIDHLRTIRPQHLLAYRLEAFSLLKQRDAAGALASLKKSLKVYATDAHLLAWQVAATAANHDSAGQAVALAQFDALFPRSELALFTTGRVLSMNRQYAAAEAALKGAIERRPNLPAAWVELGLVLMQAGDEPKAARALERAAELDPFDRRAGNQLKLVRELLTYQTIETEHFVIKYQSGIDEALARDMPDELEKMYRELTGIFQHQPRNKTIIEILPDLQRFAVRVIGIPEIWTIGASTGDIIAITPPRDGSGQRGPFDWLRVIRHEFVHTVTLDQTSNRVAHWYTEGVAVWQEPGDRDYDTARLLAQALQADELFALDDISWGFIRPKREIDRPLAYAQACWMVQYITASHSQQAVVDILRLFDQGATDRQAIEQVLGVDGDVFMQGFLSWAREQVADWGLAPPRYDERARQLLSTGQLEAEVLDELLSQYPEDPDLLLLDARRALQGADALTARQAVLRYAAARPVDPWSHEKLVEIALAIQQPQQAVGSLMQLDSQEQHSGVWAVKLAQITREAGDLQGAQAAMLRAIHREPYNASYRELAAAIALQKGDSAQALHQLQSLPMLEPDRVIHQVRLAALYARLGMKDQAHAAAIKAREIDPQAPVAGFMKSE